MEDYIGIANLEAMREAKKYNRFLVDLVLRVARPGYVIVDFGAGRAPSRCRSPLRAGLSSVWNPLRRSRAILQWATRAG